MALATWWRGDLLPELSPISNFRVEWVTDVNLISTINGLTLDEASQRLSDQHRAYMAFVADEPVAYGWVALETASIGELSINMRLSGQERYLWDFATLPNWQGYGIYPRLLQSIIRYEVPTAERFWILSAPENIPSEAGIEKSGFTVVAELSFAKNLELGLIPISDEDRVQIGAKLFGVPITHDDLAPCWCCQSSEGDRAIAY